MTNTHWLNDFEVVLLLLLLLHDLRVMYVKEVIICWVVLLLLLWLDNFLAEAETVNDFFFSGKKSANGKGYEKVSISFKLRDKSLV